MNVLELFAGSRSFSRAAEKRGHNTFTSDIEQFGGIDYVVDVLEFDTGTVPFTPDVIWASPPCTGFSVASIGTHWGGGFRAYEPKTDTARLGVALVKRTLEIIRHFQEKNPDLKFYIENPRGVLRKLSVLGGYHRDIPLPTASMERSA